ncbi:outer membrane protein assembly factor BamB family protein [Catalinimonas niigatensis]|uniref:outer membrane protein assembly factor BamB family protein n=1 Tax=Catalinimonas niigatensis TaxID=1397264 RepID=UPI00266665C7|nr:PQQ-binding-like beta-propeller repeat protein [Catalinimonas niigatensis]WPP49187.1 PQQ-binding-like beta-propeller repeat protein [Catalinimonas niigatensis]
MQRVKASPNASICNISYLLLLSVLVLSGCDALSGERGSAYSVTESSPSPQHVQWQDYGGGSDQSKYVALDQITKSNVGELEIAWSYSTGDDQGYQFNPLIVDSVMYVLAKNNSLVALDARTGEELWIHANLQGMARRGINYWESADREDRRLLFQMNNYLQAIDANTGQSILSFGDSGLVDLRAGLGRDPKTITRAQSGTPGKIFENLLLLGSSTGEGYVSSPGYLRAYDVESGALVWTFHTIPQPGEYGYETWPKDAYQYAGGVNTWGEISVDEARGIAYYPLGSPTYDYYGADRIGSNLYGNCILALDARTGERKWHYQLVHHDLWDYDLTAAPQLVTVAHEGEEIDAVAVATKHGFLFVFDRESGEPLWPIEEREVPGSEVPGEQAWPTQPFPTVLPPISRQSITPEDLTASLSSPEEQAAWDHFVTPEERTAWKKRLDTANIGLFVPLSHTKETLAMPGATGGTNWGNTASNPKKGIVYVMSQSYPSIYKKLETKEQIEEREKLETRDELVAGQDIYTKNCLACHGKEQEGAVGPSLLHLKEQYNFGDFQQLMATGRGEMPAFLHIEEDEMLDLYKFLGGEVRRYFSNLTPGNEAAMPEGPVVASGGAPRGQEERTVVSRGTRFGLPYPEEVDAPSVRYYSEGYGLGHPYIMPPPWSEIMAYDLNLGTILWKVPLGRSENGANTGLPRGSQRNGMIVTSTGLVFATARDSRIYAFDADTGEELWVGELPTGTEGLPAMYAVNGRQYLVINASTPPTLWGHQTKKDENESSTLQRAYVVFALPE